MKLSAFALQLRATPARPRLTRNAGLWNVMELPATAVPLGLSTEGLPLGCQLVAGSGADHVSSSGPATAGFALASSSACRTGNNPRVSSS